MQALVLAIQIRTDTPRAEPGFFYPIDLLRKSRD
jgi:hypothetical protein